MTSPQAPLPQKLLVVDDDENNRDMLSRRLARQGYAVEVAEDGAQALEKINAAQYDLVLLDQMMPGMSGLDLLRLLRATYSPSDLPVIMVTAVDQSETVVEALNGGANDYVTKPVDMPVVSARIQAQLSRSSAEKQIRESEQRQALARSGADGLWDANLVSGKLFVGAEWITLLGYEKGEIGDTVADWLQILHPADRPRVEEEFNAAIGQEGREFHCEYRVRSKNGAFRWALAKGSLTHDGRGKPLRMAGSLTDLTQLKFSDSLTGLGNRSMLLDGLGEVLQAESADVLALILLDLDGFKLVNDSHGDHVGDGILIEVARRLRQAVAASNFSGAATSRIGGDEFTILVPSIQSAGQVTAFCDAALAAISQPVCVEGIDLSIAASFGIVIDPPRDSKPQDVLRDAELAMYRAKELGRNRCQFFETEMRERAFERMALVRDLRLAVDQNQLVAVYQPKVDLVTRKIVGFEALLRWKHPERGMLSPLQFIPLAEESGLIVPIGEWILKEAAHQLASWQKAFPKLKDLSMNVNLSVKQLVDPGLVKRVAAIVAETGIAPGALKLELTESSLMTDIESAKAVLTELQGMGIGLKLDDFGTGYSSLSYLRALHFDGLKIDRSFVAKLNSDTETHAIIETIINLAHTLGMTVVAEGIEEEQQFDELAKLGCDVGQGYLFSRPVGADAAGLLLQAV